MHALLALPLLLGAGSAQEEPAPPPAAQETASQEPATAPATIPVTPANMGQGNTGQGNTGQGNTAQDNTAPAKTATGELRFEGTLEGVEDGQDFAETPGYRRLLEILTRYGPEDLRTRVTRDLDFKAALAAPEAWRGEIVHTRGLLAGLTAERLNTPLGEHVDVYRATLIQPDGSAGVIVDFLTPPPAGIIPERDVLDIEGVFFRAVRYETKKGTQTAPYLLARDIRVLDVEALPRRTLFDTMGLLLIGAAGAFLVIRILLTLRKRPHKRESAQVSEAIRQRARFAHESHRPAKP